MSDAYGLDRVFLVSPSSTEERLTATVAACRGWVYATSVMGVTGARAQSSTAAPGLVERVIDGHFPTLPGARPVGPPTEHRKPPVVRFGVRDTPTGERTGRNVRSISVTGPPRPRRKP